MYVTESHSKDQKIYSRNRIVFQKPKKKNHGGYIPNFNFKNKPIFKILLIVLVEFLVVRNTVNAMNPIVEMMCKNRAKSIATMISNNQANIVMEKYTYQDLAVVLKDDSGKIQMVKLNIVPVNQIISDVAIAIQQELNNTKSTEFGIRLGSATGLRLLSGSGPYIKVKMSTIGNVETALKSEFKTAGINQTLHQIYLNISCEVSILTPFCSTTEKINNQILIAESIIVGDIPSSYYNFDNINYKDAMETIE